MDARGEQADTGGWSLGPAIGAGASGEVRRGERDGRTGAVKLAADPAGNARLAREHDTLARLSHPSIVRVLDHGERAGRAWLVLELVAGSTLLHHRGTPPLPVPTVLGIAGALASALAHAHAAGVAHRDLKPSNVILRPDGRPVILDFGAATLGDTVLGPRPGTPGYAPPEWQAEGSDPRAADVFALGVMTWELICGRPAPQGAPLELPAGDTAPNAASWLVRVATAPDPRDRPTAVELEDRLSAWAIVPPPASETLTSGSQPTLDVPSTTIQATQVGRYALRGVLGRGGAGTVYRAFDPVLGREVALKRLHAIDGPSRVRFEREARTLAGLDHPDIVRVLDFGADDGALYYTMPLIDAPDLREVLRCGPVRREQAVRWTLAIANALAAAHRAGVVHRDVKPANVLIERDHPRLVDFGLATHTSGETLTVTGQVMGTPAYMSPEQAMGRPVDARTDVYAVGVVLYELIAGTTPFAADHPAAILHGVLHGEPRALVDVAPGTPRLLARVCHRALSRDPADRYPTMDALIADLERAARGEQVTAAGTWRVRARRLWAERRGVIVTAAVAGVVGVALVGPVVVDGVRTSQREAWAAERLAILRAQKPAPQYDAFFALPEVAGTHALVEARLELAAQSQENGDPDAAIAQCATAFSGATASADEERALTCLGDLFLAGRAWSPLAGVVAALDDRKLGASAVDLRRASAVARGDLAGAAALGGAIGPALAGLAGAAQAEAPYTAAAAIDVDGDGKAELFGVTGTSPITWLPGGAWSGTPRPLEGETGAYNRLRAVDGGAYGPLLLGWGHPEPGAPPSTVVWRLSPTPRRVASFVSDPTGPAAMADLDGDGKSSLYLSVLTYQRDLFALTPDPTGEAWTLSQPHPPSSNTNSDIMGIVALPEGLAVGSTSFSAYDLRLLRADPDDTHLRLAGRRHVGTIDTMVGLPRPGAGTGLLLAHRGADPRRAKASDPELPNGAFVFDAALNLVASAPLPITDCSEVYVGALDADGVPDAVVVCHDEAVVLRQAAEGSLDSAAIAGLAVVAAGDADGDGDMELYGHAANKPWVVGTGLDHLPYLGRNPEPVPPPAGASRSAAAAWRRAEDVVRMGRIDVARAAFDALAAADDGGAGGEALLRAALLSVKASDAQGALDRYGKAADLPAVARVAMGRAADLAAEHLRFDEAIGWTDRWLSLPGDDDRERRVAERSAWASLAGAPQLTLDPGLDARWRVDRPLELRAVPEGLRIDSTSGGQVAHIPLTRVAEHIGLRGALSLQHGEYDSHVWVGLVPVEAPDERLWLWLRGTGSTDRVMAWATCLSADQGLANVGFDQSSTAWQGELSFSLQATSRSRACSLTGETSTEVTGLVGVNGRLGDWELVIASREDEIDEQLSVVLRSLQLTGFVLRDVPPTRGEQLSRAIATQRFADALALQPGGSPEEDVLATVTLGGLGRSDDAATRARDAVARWPADALQPWLTPILRTGAPQLASMWQAALGPRWNDVFLYAWQMPISMHRSDPGLALPLLLQLHDPIASDDPRVVFELERARATALLGAHEDADAGAAADRAIGVARAMGAEGRPLLAAALRTKALAVASWTPNVAVAALQEALLIHPAPETLADALVADPGLQPLRRDPRWAEIEAARQITAGR